MIKNMKKYVSLLAIALVMMFGSCTKQEVYEHEITNIITIYINSQTIDNGVNSAKTRSNATTRSALTNDPKLVENTVNTVTIAIFKSDGTVKTIKEFSAPGNSVTMRVANLSTTDKVVCVANVKAGTFASVKTLDEFNNKETSLDDALTTNTVDIVANNLIMYGTGPITGSGDTYKAAVDMYHLNSKVSLNAMTLSLSNNATFTLKEIYLINVPATFKFSYDNPFSSATYLHGSLNYGIPNETQRLYLNYNGNTVNKLFFYCSPNNSVKYTKIVISGSYDVDGYGPAQPKDTYYPIIIDKNMMPNKNYGMNITIKGIGVDTPTDDLNYSNLIVTMNINPFDTVSKDVVLD